MVTAALGLIAQIAIVARAPVDTSQGVNFHALLMPDTVYVGQQTTYQVGVFIDDKLRQRLRHNPEFVPPDPQGVLAYDLPGPGRVPSVRRAGSRVYEVHIFERAFFPLAPGQYEIPSAQLVYSLPLSMSFFSREETHTLVAESLRVVARAPPQAGRPSDFTGAVGELSVASRADAAVARVGDPMLLTLSVEGRGDVKLFPRPAFSVSWGSTVAGQERVHLDTTTDVVYGSKDFDWLVTPRDSGDLAIPPIRYPYFNPYTERYEIAETAPQRVHVAPGTLARADTGRIDASPALSIRSVYRGPVPAPLYDSPGFLMLVAGGPLPAALLAVRRRPKRVRRRAIQSAAVRLAALVGGGRVADPATVRRLFVRALVERFDLPPVAFTDASVLSHALRREGVTTAAADSAELVLRTLDRAAFASSDSVPAARGGRGSSGVESSDLARRAHTAYEAVVAEARARQPGARGWRRSGTAVALMISAALVSASVVRGLSGDTSAAEQREFRDGVTNYQAGSFAASAMHFATVARLAPRASDAWANAGTAAWAMGDTTDAVVGWQRAGRLEPQASDVRDRLAMVRASQDGPIARLPAAPAPWLADIALASWLLACGVAAYRIARGRRALSLASVGCAVGALLTASLAVLADEQSAARHVYVVDAGASLFAAPALAAERMARLDAGDVALALHSEGVWTRIRLDGDREGWIESGRLISLERARAARPSE